MTNHEWMVGVIADLIEYARKNQLRTVEADLLVALFGSGLPMAHQTAVDLMDRQKDAASKAETSGLRGVC